MRVLSCCFLVFVLSGCTHNQLRRNTVNQSQTLTGIYEQQVLNNLAMFAANPHAVPHFAYPSSGASDVTDKGSLSGSPLNEFRQKVGLSVDRTSKLGWTMKPVTDPDKIKRMRCAYQRAVGCGNDGCIECCDLRKQFVGKPDTTVTLFDEDGNVATDPFTGQPYEGTVRLEPRQSIDPTTNSAIEGPLVLVYVPVVTDPTKLDWGWELRRRRVYTETREPALDENDEPRYVYIREELHGRMDAKRLPNFDCNSACEVGPCWFKRYDCTDLPKTCNAYVGRHLDTRIWVPPSGRDAFGRLVLEILDYALKDPPPATSPAEKEVTIYLDEFGEPSNESEAFQVVKTIIKINEDNIAAESGKIEKPVDTPEPEDEIANNTAKLMSRGEFTDENLRIWASKLRRGERVNELGINPKSARDAVFVNNLNNAMAGAFERELKAIPKDNVAETGTTDAKTKVRDKIAAKIAKAIASTDYTSQDVRSWQAEIDRGAGIPKLEIAAEDLSKSKFQQELEDATTRAFESALLSRVATEKARRQATARKEAAKKADARKADAAASRTKSLLREYRQPAPAIDYRILEQNLDVLGGG